MMMMADAKGKGKDMPQQLPRTRVSAEKFQGTVDAWKGKYGWIAPAESIPHDKAAMHNGHLFFSMNDIMGGEALEAGTPVEFHICEDEKGLGAEEVEATGPPQPGYKGSKGSAKGKDGGKGDQWSSGKGKAGGLNGKANGGWKGGHHASVWAPVMGVGGKSWDPDAPAPWYGGAGKAYGKSKDAAAALTGGVKAGGKNGAKAGGKSFGKESFGKESFGKESFGKEGGKEKGAGKGGKGKGHTLPRTRVSAEKFQGTVKSWRGKYGWIVPAEEIQHEKATKNNGCLFVSMDDLGGLAELPEGAAVEFHIWEDATGLGAEEVVLG